MSKAASAVARKRAMARHVRRRPKKGYGGTSKGFREPVPLLRGGVL